MANLTELAPRELPKEDHSQAEAVHYLKPTQRFRELERLNRDYYLNLLDLQEQTKITQAFLRHTRILHESLYDHEDIALETSPPQFQDDTGYAGRVVVFERYFPLTYQYFMLYTPDSQSSRYTDTDFKIASLLTPNLIRRRFMDLPRTNIHTPPTMQGIDMDRSPTKRDGNTFMSLQTVSPFTHLSVDRMDRIVNSLQQALTDKSDNSADAITFRDYELQRRTVTELTDGLRVASGRETASALREFLGSLNEYRLTGHDIPGTVSYTGEDELIDVDVSIEHQQMAVTTASQDILCTLSADDSDRTALYTGDITRILLPYLHRLIYAKTGEKEPGVSPRIHVRKSL